MIFFQNLYWNIEKAVFFNTNSFLQSTYWIQFVIQRELQIG